MVSHLFFYQLVLLGLLWLCVMLHYVWPNACTGGAQRPSKSLPPPPMRSRDLKPFPGLTRKPPCAACEQAHAYGPQPPGCPPPHLGPTRGRPREVDPSFHFCPNAIRAVARVFEVAPNTGLQWLVEAADHLQAFSQYFLHPVHVTQVQLDALYALLSAVKAGEVSETEAIQCLSRSPQWVWAAIDPVTKLFLTIDVGDRTLAMAQSVVHQVVQVLAPGCVPLFLTDGFKASTTALLTHDGQWVQPARRHATGPAPKPRWMPLPPLL